ncbi:NUDIX domain-containing protein [Candidatus Woesearchaeota archaeon]|nr:NUDIX domain-containing protein [Candidatus Woesearchaeota archaeon]
MEFLDIIDAHNRVVGKASRIECHRKKLWHRAVMVIVSNTRGHVFVQHRSYDKETFPGYYEASLSGHVRAGETLKAAAIRELKEELRISTRKLQHLGDFRYAAWPEREHMTVYALKSWAGHTGLNRKEAHDGRYLPVAEVRKLLRTTGKCTPWFRKAWTSYGHLF